MGGSASIPKLQQLLKDRFPTADILNSIPPEEVAAIGAAKEVSFYPKMMLNNVYN